MMAITPDEWLDQANYEIESAEYNLKGGRNLYAVYMCHLAIEKALKGLYWKKLNQLPPKSHHLPSLVNKIGITLSSQMLDFIAKLNEAQVFSRYPDSMAQAAKDFPFEKVNKMLIGSKEVLEWIRKQW